MPFKCRGGDEGQIREDKERMGGKDDCSKEFTLKGSRDMKQWLEGNTGSREIFLKDSDV